MKPPPITLSGTVPTITDIDHETIADELEDRSAQEALEWMFESFGADHYIACSFQKTSSVTAHMASTVNPEARFFYLDTDVLFEETYETRDRLGRGAGDRVRPLPQPDPGGAGRRSTATSSGRATPIPAADCARSSRCGGPFLP